VSYCIAQPAGDNTQAGLIRVISFERPLRAEAHEVLTESGIQLINYVTGNTYVAYVPRTIDPQQFPSLGVSSVARMGVDMKVSPGLSKTSDGDSVHVLVTWSEFSAEDQVQNEIRRLGRITELNPLIDNAVTARVSRADLVELAGLDDILWIEEAPQQPELLNYECNESTRVTAMTIPGVPGRNLDGSGVMVGLADGAGPVAHIDFDNRILNYATGGAGPAVLHAYLTTGMIGAAGNRLPRHAGPAPRATIYTERFSNILNNVTAFLDRGGVITSNSWGAAGSFGLYSATSNWIDQQAKDNPALLHVFAAGNSGTLNVPPYSGGFNSVYSHYQSAKNLISVGSVWTDDSPYAGSSKGPTSDGRIKPDICAVGVQVVSTATGNGYSTGFAGTSFACPGVAGALALLYQRYRQLNGGTNPDAALAKALICNTADDIGNTGPDFTSGWGRINVRRAVELLEANTWTTATIQTAQANSHTITVPPGVSALRVMIYWSDEPAAPYAPYALVNDLDLSVVTPTQALELPWILDRSASGVALPAGRGVDHLNNIEQVVIQNPAAGVYVANVEGFNVPFGPQDYYLVYELVKPEIVVTYPAGGESFVPDEIEYLRWDAPETMQDSFSVSYSADGGATWSLIAGNVPGTRRWVGWTVPSTQTSNALLKVTANSSGISGQSVRPFTVVGSPLNMSLTAPCPGFIEVTWDSVAGAAGYEVLVLDTFMKPHTLSPTNKVIIDVADPSKMYWIAVRALAAGGGKGRHCMSQPIIPNAGSTCPWPNELALDTLTISTALIGRQFTSTGLGVENVGATVINRGNNMLSGFDLEYTVNGSTFSEHYAGVLNPGDTVYHSFASPYDFSQAATYYVNGSVKLSGDGFIHNNSLPNSIQLVQLENQPVTLPVVETFESLQPCTYSGQATGLQGLARVDYDANTGYGQLRTAIDGWYTKSGSKALTLDVGTFGIWNTNFLTYTVNLSQHVTDTLLMNFSIAHHGESVNAYDSVWVRGSDTDPWLPVMNLPFTTWSAGVFNTFFMVPIGDVLLVNGQQPSSSFQVRFGQQGHMPATEGNKYAGYTLDDITIYTRPRAHAGDDTAVCSLRPVVLGGDQSVTGGIPPFVYEWTPSAGLNSDTVPNPVVTAASTTAYTLTVTDALGFKATDVVTVDVEPCVALEVFAILQGPYDESSGLMNDWLRTQNLVPLQEPYAAAGYAHVHGGGETTTPQILAAIGNKAIVDWVVVELRPSDDATSVVASQSALLQRDGTVIGADGGELLFSGFPQGDYFVSVRHRNHLGVMTKTAQPLDAIGSSLDFTAGPSIAYGTAPQVRLSNGTYALWAGNVNGDGRLDYLGEASDRGVILPVLTKADLTRTAAGYYEHDTNMDGLVKYVGKANDRALILRNLGGFSDTTLTEQIP
jgi:subtilisin family serine protease